MYKKTQNKVRANFMMDDEGYRGQCQSEKDSHWQVVSRLSWFGIPSSAVF